MNERQLITELDYEAKYKLNDTENKKLERFENKIGQWLLHNKDVVKSNGNDPRKVARYIISTYEYQKY